MLVKTLFLVLTALSQVHSCADSATFTFGSYYYNKGITTRDCAWVLKANVATRREKWCTTEYMGTIVQDECPFACDVCPATNNPSSSISPSSSPTRPPSPMPSPFPSAKPSPSPSVSPEFSPSSSPSRPPSPYPSPFPTARPSSSPSFSPSDQPTSRPSMEPTFKPTGLPTLSVKPSPSPSAAPIDQPTVQPSTEPTLDPTNRPTESIKPSPSPSAAPVELTESPSGFSSATPTSVPTFRATLPCVDSPLRLKIESKGRSTPFISRYCSWVGQRDIMNRCAMPGVSAACPLTCGSCDTCADPSELRFKFMYNGKEMVRNCDFIGRIDHKVYGRCKASENICRSTCGAC